MLDLLFQFILELFRALLIDQLSTHVCGRLSRFWSARRSQVKLTLRWRVHRLNRDRLLHRLRTESEEDP